MRAPVGAGRASVGAIGASLGVLGAFRAVIRLLWYWWAPMGAMEAAMGAGRLL